MTPPYHITPFRAAHSQPLRNVRIHSPSIIQILHGNKHLHWQESTLRLSSTTLLLCEASASLNFENQPQQGKFHSLLFSFHCLPTEAMVALSAAQAPSHQQPTLAMDPPLQETLSFLHAIAHQNISQETHTFWLMGLYQQLAERGALHLLFPRLHRSFSQRLRHYLALNPSQPHILESAAEHFAISRATLIRKLKYEGTQYREVLMEVRLNHALQLMQNGHNNVLMLAQACGYQSEGRFSQRFKKKFGLSPSHYMKTLSDKTLSGSPN